MVVSAPARADGIPLIALDAVGSTNAEALQRARMGTRGPLWLTAHEQSSGRGRHGRRWTSPPGNLYASLLLTNPCPPARAAELAFVSGLALHDSVVNCAPSLANGVRLKWPNDLLIADAKAGGILIEAEGAGSDAFCVVVGFGVNCASHPEDTGYPVTDLAHQGAPVAPARLLDVLACSMNERLRQWSQGSGFATIRNDWLSRVSGLGKRISVLTGAENVAAVFSGIDMSGRLQLKLADGSTRNIATGEVFNLEADSSRAHVTEEPVT